MNIAVATFAICSLCVAGSQCLSVDASFVLRLLVSVAGDAGRFGKTHFVGQALDVSMAINAGKHGTVNRRLESISMDVLAIHHRCITVTGKTIVIGGLWRGCGLVPCKRKPSAGKHQA